MSDHCRVFGARWAGWCILETAGLLGYFDAQQFVVKNIQWEAALGANIPRISDWKVTLTQIIMLCNLDGQKSIAESGGRLVTTAEDHITFQEEESEATVGAGSETVDSWRVENFHSSSFYEPSPPPSLMFDVNKNWSPSFVSACLHAMHCTALRPPDWMIVWTSRCVGVPNNTVSAYVTA